MSKPHKPQYVLSRSEVALNIVVYDKCLDPSFLDKQVGMGTLTPAEQASFLNTVSHTQAWIFVMHNGQWIAGSVKVCGLSHFSLSYYNTHRKNLSGTIALARVEQLCGFDTLPPNHPGVLALKAKAKAVGKSIRPDARFLALKGENLSSPERETVDSFAVLIQNANLSKAAITNLLDRTERIKAWAK